MTETTCGKHVLLAGCLESDRRLSMKRYSEQVWQSLACTRDPVTSMAAPWGQSLHSRVARAIVRRVTYPFCVSRFIRQSPGLSLVHVLDQFYAYLVRPEFHSAVTCHDVADFHMTDMSSAQLDRWRNRVMAMRKASLIFADSSATAGDLVTMLGISEERIVVNHLGVDPMFCCLGAGYRYTSRVTRLRDRARTECLVLHVGSNLKRKNVSVLLHAVRDLRRLGWPVTLVKVGDSIASERVATKDWDLARSWTSIYARQVRDLGLNDAVVDLGQLSDEALVETYNSCAVFAFPSRYEGFGLPVLEAQACGLPCVLAHAASLPEVGGRAALYHDADDPKGLADAIVQVVTDTSLRERLVTEGRRNAARFTWGGHAVRLREGYDRVFSTACRRPSEIQAESGRCES